LDFKIFEYLLLEDIIFRLDSIEYIGRLRTILAIDNGEPHLLVAYLSNHIPLTCVLGVDDNFAYPHILHN
jgi:hypothetical protein